MRANNLLRLTGSGQTDLGTGCALAQALLQAVPVVALGATVVLAVPQVQHTGRVRAFLATYTGVDQPHGKVGVFVPPAFEHFVETVDSLQVVTPDPEVAGAYPLPA